MRESSWLISAWKANVSVSEAMTRPFPNARREEEAAARGRRRVGFVGSARACIKDEVPEIIKQILRETESIHGLEQE